MPPTLKNLRIILWLNGPDRDSFMAGVRFLRKSHFISREVEIIFQNKEMYFYSILKGYGSTVLKACYSREFSIALQI